MKYIPQVDDYVRWKSDYVNIEGWVYFYDEEYITIETGIKPKPNCQYAKNDRHKYIHTLLLCHPWFWHELEYVYTRKNKHGETLEDMVIFLRNIN
jgi:hypothetical protein